MFLPIWILATMLFIGLLLAIIFGARKSRGDYDFSTPFINLSLIAGVVFLYLIFWIIYLAVT